MSFSLYSAGSKAKVLRELKAVTPYGGVAHETLRDSLVKIIEDMPDGCGARISCSGHHDYSGTNPTGSATMELNIFKLE